MVRVDRGWFTFRSHTARTLSWRMSVRFMGFATGNEPLCVIPNDSGVDEAAEIECLGSELGHNH